MVAIRDHPFTPSQPSSLLLERLERANLFIVPLDDELRWYRYHHLFADLLQQRLMQGKQLKQIDPSPASDPEKSIAELHIRASQWFEDNDLIMEAFQHATAASDIECAERLIKRMPLHFRGVVNMILDWLSSPPKAFLDEKPSLSVRFATLSLMAGQTTGVEESLQAAESALLATHPGGAGVLPETEALDENTCNLIGQIAAVRATLSLTRYQPEAIIPQAQRALEYLSLEDLPFRFTAVWTLAFAYYLQGDRAGAVHAYREAHSISQESGDIFSVTLALSELGQKQELENNLYEAVETYQRVLPLFGDHPHPNAGEVYLGLARGDVDSPAEMIAQTDKTVRQNNFIHRLPEVAATLVLVLLKQDNLRAAADLAQTHNLPLSQARVHLAGGDTDDALAVLGSFCEQMESTGWQDELLRGLVLQSVALYVAAKRKRGEKEQALTGRVLLGLAQITGIKIYGIDNPDSPRYDRKGGVIVFSMQSRMATQLARELAERGGIGVRSGCHCAHMLIKRLVNINLLLELFQGLIVNLFPKIALPGLTRVSLGIENSAEQIDNFARATAERVYRLEGGDPM